MIVTLTLNPAIDKTAEINPLVIGGLNRVKSFSEDVGGKGINVSKVVAMLGANSVATGFIGEKNSTIIESELNNINCKNEFIKVDGNTRVNLKLYDNKNGITEINEPGIIANEQQEQQLMNNLLQYASKDNIFVLAGSMHKNANINMYEVIIKKIKAKDVYIILDADNEAFVHAIKAKPNFIKPNKDELLRYFNKETASIDELIEMCKSLVDEGIQTVVLSMGKDGALFITKKEGFKSNVIDLKVESTVGAGDSMVGAFAYAKLNNLSFSDAAILAMACSNGAVTTKGTTPPSLELVNELKKRVELKKIY